MKPYCYLTGEPLKDVPGTLPKEDYYVLELHNRQFQISICRNCLKRMQEYDNFEQYRAPIRALLLNNRLDIDGKTIHWDTDDKREFALKKFLEEAIYPRTPLEKINNLFIELFKLQKYGGIEVIIWKKLFMSTIF